jgi:cytochrome P450
VTDAMTNYATADYYTDTALVDDPHAYFAFLREQGPVTRLPHRNVVAITGYDEAVQVMLDTEHFSSINAVTGPIPGLPFEPVGDDISSQLEAHRHKIAFADQVVTVDGQRHLDLRSVMATLFTPSRLKALEPSLVSTADALIDEFIEDGTVDLPKQYGCPYATLMIADLLGIPADGRKRFRDTIDNAVPAPVEADGSMSFQDNPLIPIGKDIFKYIAKRRLFNKPLIRPIARALGLAAKTTDMGTEDILTELALARYPNGTTPSLADVTGLGAFLFGAGQDTTNRLLASAFRVLAEQPEIQTELRDNPKRIPEFIEELLRFDGSVKSGGRMCKKTVTIGGVEIKAGTTLLLTHMGANRDPRRFENPDLFDLNRKKAKEHLAFGRGAHTCIGSPLARSEVRVSIERLLARLGNIRLSEAHHGPQGARHFVYENSYILRAMKELHLEFDVIG